MTITDPYESDNPSKPSPRNIVEWVCYILPSAADNVHYAPSMKSNPPPLVTVDQIRNGKKLCIHRVSGCCILEIGPSTILKVGYTVTMGEAEAMLLVRKRTSVPVPRDYNAYTIDNNRFIVMEKVPGVQLEVFWETLSRRFKESIIRQLRGYVQQWRRIKGPFFGSVDGGRCQDVIFKHPYDDTEYDYGPFRTRAGFNEGMVQALKNSRPGRQLIDEDHAFAQKPLASGPGPGETKVLTHGDLHQSNIMVQGDLVSGIVDWGAAGYSVAAREYFCLRWSAMDDEWQDLSRAILPGDEYRFGRM